MHKERGGRKHRDCELSICPVMAIWKVLLILISVTMKGTQSREKNLLQGQPDGPWRAGTQPRSAWLQSGDTAGYPLFHLQPPTSLMPHPSGPAKIALPFCFPLFIHPVNKCLLRPRFFPGTEGTTVSKGDSSSGGTYVLMAE